MYYSDIIGIHHQNFTDDIFVSVHDKTQMKASVTNEYPHQLVQ